MANNVFHDLKMIASTRVSISAGIKAYLFMMDSLTFYAQVFTLLKFECLKINTSTIADQIDKTADGWYEDKVYLYYKGRSAATCI